MIILVVSSAWQVVSTVVEYVRLCRLLFFNERTSNVTAWGRQCQDEQKQQQQQQDRVQTIQPHPAVGPTCNVSSTWRWKNVSESHFDYSFRHAETANEAATAAVVGRGCARTAPWGAMIRMRHARRMPTIVPHQHALLLVRGTIVNTR